MAYELDDFGSYTVGGRLLEVEGQPKQHIQFTPTASFDYDPNGSYAIAHAYVQYFKPVRKNGQPPIILLHGGGMSGTTWETTPDGRPGWLQLLVGSGYEVHVVDNVERGRAGWCAVDGVWPDKALLRTMDEAWHLFRIGDRDGFAQRRAFDGCRFPIAAFEAFARSFVPRWTSTTEEATEAFRHVLRHLGGAIVLCHSQGGQIAFEAAAREQGVDAIVGVEPSGFTITVKKSESIDLNITVDQAFQFVVSCGVVIPPQQLTSMTKRTTDLSDNGSAIAGPAPELARGMPPVKGVMHLNGAESEDDPTAHSAPAAKTESPQRDEGS